MTLTPTRILSRNLAGSSSPVVVETDDGLFLVKLRGAAQGTATLVAEVIAAGIADRLGLAVPERKIIRLEIDTPSDDVNDELADLRTASVGENLGFRFLDDAVVLNEEDACTIDPDWELRVRWFDWLLMNPDRSPVNTNILRSGETFYLIDHGSALPFQYGEAWPERADPAAAELPVAHLFDHHVDRLSSVDAELTGLLGVDELHDIAAAIPDSFLRPLLAPSATTADVDRLRMEYVDFLARRLASPRRFRTEPVPERTRGAVPDWAVMRS